jgi:AcrR family transcriptional regulator
MKRQRLSRQSWIDAGLKALVSQGPTALAAEPLARELSATKGSFYWHFKYVPDLQDAVLLDWQTRAFASVVNDLAESGTAEQRLRRFGRIVLSDSEAPAFRAWAQTDAKVASALAQVDAERLTYVSNLLKQLGIKNPQFAQSSLAALIGLPQLPGKTNATKAYDTLIDLVLALK